MSAICLVVVRNAKNRDTLILSLLSYCQQHGITITDETKEEIDGFSFLSIDSNSDFVFYPGEMNDCGDSSFFSGHDGYVIKGETAVFPLSRRLTMLQDLARLCVSASDKVELFLSSDPPELEDYFVVSIPINDLAKKLEDMYHRIPSWCHDVPDVHVFVQKQMANT